MQPMENTARNSFFRLRTKPLNVFTLNKTSSLSTRAILSHVFARMMKGHEATLLFFLEPAAPFRGGAGSHGGFRTAEHSPVRFSLETPPRRLPSTHRDRPIPRTASQRCKSCLSYPFISSEDSPPVCSRISAWARSCKPRNPGTSVNQMCEKYHAVVLRGNGRNSRPCHRGRNRQTPNPDFPAEGDAVRLLRESALSHKIMKISLSPWPAAARFRPWQTCIANQLTGPFQQSARCHS